MSCIATNRTMQSLVRRCNLSDMILSCYGTEFKAIICESVDVKGVVCYKLDRVNETLDQVGFH